MSKAALTTTLMVPPPVTDLPPLPRRRPCLVPNLLDNRRCDLVLASAEGVGFVTGLTKLQSLRGRAGGGDRGRPGANKKWVRESQSWNERLPAVCAVCGV